MDWTNRQLRRVPNWLIYIIGATYPTWLLYQGLTGQLGVDPVKVMEHAMGEASLQLLILGLAITPLRQRLGLNLIKMRRAIGVLAFFYVALHLLVWLVLDVQILSQVWADIVKRPYITIGMVGFLIMIPLAVTSNNLSVRRLGAKWRRLHRLTYAVVLLGAVHFMMVTKGFQLEPLLYLLTVCGLLALRLPRFSARTRRRAGA